LIADKRLSVESRYLVAYAALSLGGLFPPLTELLRIFGPYGWYKKCFKADKKQQEAGCFPLNKVADSVYVGRVLSFFGLEFIVAN
jgi:hypothetical protein